MHVALVLLLVRLAPTAAPAAAAAADAAAATAAADTTAAGHAAATVLTGAFFVPNSALKLFVQLTCRFCASDHRTTESPIRAWDTLVASWRTVRRA